MELNVGVTFLNLDQPIDRLLISLCDSRDLPLSRRGHQALLVSMWPSAALHVLPPEINFSLEAVSLPNGGSAISSRQAVSTRVYLLIKYGEI